jgi:hypothetical protein
MHVKQQLSGLRQNSDKLLIQVLEILLLPTRTVFCTVSLLTVQKW